MSKDSRSSILSGLLSRQKSRRTSLCRGGSWDKFSAALGALACETADGKYAFSDETLKDSNFYSTKREIQLQTANGLGGSLCNPVNSLSPEVSEQVILR